MKFRAWNTALNKMYYDVGINPFAKDYHVFDKDGAINDMYGSMPTLMPYTGLTDKNGKEIYEGDVVKILYTDWGSQDNFQIGYVTYKAPAFEIDFGIHKKYGTREFGSMNYGTHGWIEVIGNIYENPELMSPKLEQTT